MNATWRRPVLRPVQPDPMFLALAGLLSPQAETAAHHRD